MVVILVGPPGVGKGTQGMLLAAARGFRHLSTGDLLRAAREDGTEMGLRLQTFMDRGELVPDQLIVDLVRAFLQEIDGVVGVVFDGFPRTVGQAEALGSVLAQLGRKIDVVVALEADDDVLVKRVAGRRNCGQCGAVYHVNFSPPKQDGTCDRCGGALTHRPDDDPATVRHRLEVYWKETAPLIRHYEEGQAPVRRIEGDRSVTDVQRAIQEVVGA